MIKISLKAKTIACKSFTITMRRSSNISAHFAPPPIYQNWDKSDRKDRIAFIDDLGSHTYGDLSRNSDTIAQNINRALGQKSDQANKISFLCENNSSYVNTLFGIWKAGQVAVPLCKSHPSQTLEYYVTDSDSVALIASQEHIDKVTPFTMDSKSCQLIRYEDLSTANGGCDPLYVSVFLQLNSIMCPHNIIFWIHTQVKYDIFVFLQQSNADGDGILIYTSGTTGPPKGVVLTHANLINQVMQC